MTVTIYHNPKCGTSRNALNLIREAGVEPEVVEYLKTGWTADQLKTLLKRMGKGPRDILRTRGAPPEAVALVGDGASDEAIVVAMTAYPGLVERPIVESGKGAVLARPFEKAREVL